ncbi:Uncharacterised protein [Metamycoplasma alkalescens]|uniref:Uncharacterized protein n=1 Tax=Metamycoplasma alkalescens TaxID=45363 RepID=A0A3B0P0L0_9BACT|nr:Uncharacterised protein [Metamycoplasma alkalescens]
MFNFLVQEEKTINVTSEQKKQQQTTPTPSTKKDIVSPESPKPIDKEITNLHPTNQQENVLIDKTNQPKNNQELNKDIQNTQFKTSLKDSKLEIKSSDIEVDKSLEKDNSIETPSKSTPEYYSYSITSNPSTKKELSLPSSES